MALTLRWNDNCRSKIKLEELKKTLGTKTFQATLERVIDDFEQQQRTIDQFITEVKLLQAEIRKLKEQNIIARQFISAFS